ncbi:MULTISPECIES: hypothetical protein [unclassified Sphingopyxis]|uniref:hypothetical protein n=1 Tax=unclassified Sphingopyxis TaxID=2614943 RepID=UPI002863D5A5|nr:MULTISPECIES: hypothetical protein [unclassified Sphingopyxis]MDR7061404.1 hypothetical protein [Sphingopyxis sp. BE235]MDR7181865.1 hypothetical protein [Sphingopyxis sp. BE249]
MTRLMLPAGLLLLAACSGGEDKSQPEDSAAISPLQKAERPAPAEPAVDADLPDVAEETPPKPETKTAGDGKTIPSAIRGRWALKAADCKAKKGTDLTALTIDATNLRFYESHGELARVRESDADRIVADYKFSGEGVEWDRRMQLDLADGGKTLVRRDSGEGAAAGAMRYTRCAG